MPKLDAAIFNKVELSADQKEHLEELKSSVNELIADEADVFQIKSAYDDYIEACFDYHQYEDAESGLNFIHDNSETFELSDAETADLLRHFGVLAFSKKEIDTAQQKFEKALALLEDNTEDNEELQAKLMTDLGNVESVNENFETAIDYYESAIELNEANEIDAATPFHNLGIVYLETHNVEEAVECFESALEIYQEQDNLTQQEAMHLQLGAIYLAQDNLNNALKNYHYASELQEEDSENLGKIYLTMVNILLKMGENQKAVNIYEKALPILETFSDLDIKAEHHFQIANLYRNYLADDDKAISYYQSALEMAKTEEEHTEWRDLMIAKIEDSIAICQENMQQKTKKKSGLFGRLFKK